ncbi:MAG: TIGR02450 family Trp-rich protein, partial [Cyanobacteriota bacterium]|nr:TIGR02450 family Trp-rich protein [Cyanobacteriota bacterium]
QGGRGPLRWVELAAVLAPSHRERVLWSELKDPTRWSSGWQSIPESDEDSSTQ